MSTQTAAWHNLTIVVDPSRIKDYQDFVKVKNLTWEEEEFSKNTVQVKNPYDSGIPTEAVIVEHDGPLIDFFIQTQYNKKFPELLEMRDTLDTRFFTTGTRLRAVIRKISRKFIKVNVLGAN